MFILVFLFLFQAEAAWKEGFCITHLILASLQEERAIPLSVEFNEFFTGTLTRFSKAPKATAKGVHPTEENEVFYGMGQTRGVSKKLSLDLRVKEAKGSQREIWVSYSSHDEMLARANTLSRHLESIKAPGQTSGSFYSWKDKTQIESFLKAMSIEFHNRLDDMQIDLDKRLEDEKKKGKRKLPEDVKDLLIIKERAPSVFSSTLRRTTLLGHQTVEWFQLAAGSCAGVGFVGGLTLGSATSIVSAIGGILSLGSFFVTPYVDMAWPLGKTVNLANSDVLPRFHFFLDWILKRYEQKDTFRKDEAFYFSFKNGKNIDILILPGKDLMYLYVWE